MERFSKDVDRIGHLFATQLLIKQNSLTEFNNSNSPIIFYSYAILFLFSHVSYVSITFYMQHLIAPRTFASH